MKDWESVIGLLLKYQLQIEAQSEAAEFCPDGHLVVVSVILDRSSCPPFSIEVPTTLVLSLARLRQLRN